MSLNIKHGGFSRISKAVSSAETTAWAKGRLLTINTSGEIAVSSGAANALVGVALEDRVLSTTVGPTTTATVVGAPSGEKRSMVVDFAVIENTQLQSGLTFAAGDVLYPSTTGYVTTSGSSTGSNCPKIGIALSYGHSGDSARALEMTFDVQY